MAGKFGAKQSKCLDESSIIALQEKLFEVRGHKFLWSHDLEKLCSELQVSRISYMRRAVASGMRFGVGFPLARVHDHELPGKATIIFDCTSCSSSYFENKHDLLERGDIDICGSCLRRKKCRSPERRASNSRAQFIAQNRPEVKEKMSAALKATWVRDYDSRCESMKKSYANNPSHRENVSKSSLRNWQRDEYARKIELKSRSKWGHYKGIFYQSLCELAFLLWCEDNDKTVRRFVGSIPYEFDGKIRSYRPDFVVDEKLVIEVKHSMEHEADLGRVKIVEAKYHSLKEYCERNGLFARLVEVSKDIRAHYKRSREVHDGKAVTQNSVSLHGESSRPHC
jgi:hypothetical protein